MARKIIGILVVIAILMASSLTVYAIPTEDAGTVPTSDTTVKSGSEGNTDKDSDENTEYDFMAILDNIIKDGSAANTELQSLITMTRPDSGEVTFTLKSYTISCTTDEKDIKIYLAKYNPTTKEYEAFANADGESSWDIGSKFSTDILLKEGQNKMKIVAYRTSQEKKLTPEDVQVNCFTISYLPVKIRSSIKNLTESVKTSIENIIFNKK